MNAMVSRDVLARRTQGHGSDLPFLFGCWQLVRGAQCAGAAGGKVLSMAFQRVFPPLEFAKQWAAVSETVCHRIFRIELQCGIGVRQNEGGRIGDAVRNRTGRVSALELRFGLRQHCPAEKRGGGSE